MARKLDQDALVEHWTLIGDDPDPVADKRGAAKQGFALLLKFFAALVGFPVGRIHEAELDAAVTTVAACDDLITSLARNAAGRHHLLDRIVASLDNTDPAAASDPRELQERYAAALALS